MEKTETEVKELKEQIRELKTQYKTKKQTKKEASSQELQTLKADYMLQYKTLKNPLKAEKYRQKMQKKAEHRKANEPPKRRVIEEVGNAVTHGVGALIAFACLLLMVQKAQMGLALLSAIVYGTCFVLQMLFSCLYHSFPSGSTVKRVFRRFDYSTIYLQIGGTFAPLYLVYMNEHMWGHPVGTIFFVVQWLLIATGITIVAVFGPGRIRWLHYTFYFVLGWSGIVFLPYFLASNIPLLLYILGGGVVYTLGMIPYSLLKKKKAAHFIWHFFVLLGAITQWLGIYLYVL